MAFDNIKTGVGYRGFRAHDQSMCLKVLVGCELLYTRTGSD